MTTTTCTPCEMAAAEATVDVVPEADVVAGEGSKTAPWNGPIGIEGQKTGDGRLIKADALRWDTLPVPLRWAIQDFGAHDGAYVVGKIEEIERLSYEEANTRLEASGRNALPESFEGTTIIWGIGTHDLGSEHGREAHRQVDENLTPGISMDLDDVIVTEGEGDDAGDLTIMEARVRAATQVAIPAFEGARIAADKGSVERFEEDAEEATFNWVDDVGGLPKYIKRISKHLRAKGKSEGHSIAIAVNVVKKMCATGDLNFPGSQQVNADSRAEACAAVAEWEAKKAKARADSAETITASVSTLHAAPPADWFKNPGLAEPTGLTVTPEGRVFGHIALWGTCHIGNPQGGHVCTQPPSSASGYTYFHTGLTETDKGDVATGKITMSTLHATDRLTANDAIYHYEHTGSVGADVVAGEDSFGIWVSGAARKGADLVALKAAPISGDWRTVGGSLEMVGALSVNVPGFPVPRPRALVAGGHIKSLVASGVFKAEEKSETVQTLDLDDETTVLALRERFREMDRKEKAAALAAKVSRLASLEKVRRVQASLVASGLQFGVDDQWRMPRGNGPASGRWIDMPGSSLDDLGSAMMDFFDRVDVGEEDSNALEGIFDKASEAGSKVGDALRAADGDQAKEAAGEVLESLDNLDKAMSTTLFNAGAEDADVAELNDRLASAKMSATSVRDADLSLLAEDNDLTGGSDDPFGEDPLSVKDLLGEAGVDPSIIDGIDDDGNIDVEGIDYKHWKILHALPEGSEIRTGDDVMWVDWKKDSSVEGGWVISGVVDDPEVEADYKVGGDLEGDTAMLDGGGDNPIRIKSMGGSNDLTGGSDDPFGEDPLSDADMLGEAGFIDISDDPEVMDGYEGAVRVFETEDGGYVIAEREDGKWEVWEQATGNPTDLGVVDSSAEATALVEADKAEYGDDPIDGAEGLAGLSNAELLQMLDAGEVSPALLAELESRGMGTLMKPTDVKPGDQIMSLDEWFTVTKVGEPVKTRGGDTIVPIDLDGDGGDMSPRVDADLLVRSGGGSGAPDGDVLPDDVKVTDAVDGVWQNLDDDALKGLRAPDFYDMLPKDLTDEEAEDAWAEFQERREMLSARKVTFATRNKAHAQMASRRAWTQRKIAVLAYNPDQWRVPKGNGEISGRFIDMPDAGMGELADLLGNVFETADVSPETADRVGENLDEALDAAEAATAALRAGDGDAAKAAAERADRALTALETDLTAEVEGPGISDDDADSIGGALEKARGGVDPVKDSDLSLLGDTGLDGEGRGDIGAADDAPKADAPKTPGATAEDRDGDGVEGDKVGGPGDDSAAGSEQQKNARKTADTASVLEGVLGDAAEDGSLSEDDADGIGESLDALRDSLDALRDGVLDGNYNASDLAKAQKELSTLEARLMAAADKPGLSDDKANQIGEALDNLFSDLGTLAESLKGETKPPPFANRKYSRQWLGRRGIRINTFARG